MRTVPLPNALEAQNRRVAEYGYGSAVPGDAWLENQVRYYADYLDLTEDQAVRAESCIRWWWSQHWKLFHEAVASIADEKPWELVREGSATVHRRTWDLFVGQMELVLSAKQALALKNNYPGQFDLDYSPSPAE